MANLKTISLRIGGMTCTGCQTRIEKKLKSAVGIEDASVDFSAGTASVTYNDSVLSVSEIKALIEQLDYRVLDETSARRWTGAPVSEIAGTLIIILALYMVLRGLGLGALTAAFPLAEAGMGYGMVFIIGLITSLHCTAMCGGINLSQCIPPAPLTPAEAGGETIPPLGETARPPFRQVLFPAILYNAGRVVSYTAVGTLAGALGQAVTVSGRFQGLVQLAAGAIMVIMGINMLGFFPALRRFRLHMPKFLARKIDGQRSAGKSPLVIGLLNGFMPCGPLQAMQLYALSTGSPVAGGLSMFLFSMGTVPLMFSIGALGSILSRLPRGRAITAGVMRAGAILVTVMGMAMFTYGFGLSGLNLDFARRALAAIRPAAAEPTRRGAGAPVQETVSFQIADGVQTVNSTLSPGRYPAITVQAGIPVRWTITAPAGSINGCNNRMIIREYRIEHRFTPGENVIEFTPAKTGRFPYSCWMGMIRSSITVVEEGQVPAAAENAGEPDLQPTPAGVAISTDGVAVAKILENGYQTIQTSLRDDGIEPAILVVERGIPAAWIITNNSLDPGNSRLVFPAYYTQIDMGPGDNGVQLMPSEDFEFSTADNVFYGYVKVVDDLSRVDIEAVKAEVADFETLIYPDEYFEEAAQSASCCKKDNGGGL
jgi:sulfite exporter TauE/SafE/copper chaperone CopZ